jgi:hypothetical protein
MKPVKSLVLFFCVFLVCACEHLNTVLPVTKYTLYEVTEGGVNSFFRRTHRR